MNFFEHEYDLYVMLLKPEKPLWGWETFQHLSKIIEPISTSSRGVTGVRVNQLDTTIDGGAVPIKFGKLVWKNESHQKWTHDSPLTKDKSSNWLFGSMEAWAPIWTVAQKDNTAPDLFFSITNERASFTQERELSFDTVVICAVRTALGSEYRDKVKNEMKNLTQLLKPKLSAYRTRTWGIPWSGGGFTGAIQDMPHMGLLSVGWNWESPVDLNLFDDKDNWKILG